MSIVSVSEIYDMCTVKNKVGVIGIHTPTVESIDKKWHGYFLNHRYFKPLDCDVQISCASMLPLDPLGIGTESGKVAPQDMMNPILYRAVSNDYWNVLIGRLYSTSVSGGDTVDMDKNSVRALSDAFTGSTEEQERLYYSLLAESEWRKAMPQQGMNMSHLVPLCYPIVSNFGQGSINGPTATSVPTSAIGTSPVGQMGNYPANTSAPNSARLFRGPAVSLPRLACSPQGIVKMESGDGTLIDEYYNSTYSVPRIYVGAVVMPPARLQNMYYRMKVTWRIQFSDPVSILDKRNLADSVQNYNLYYGRTYDFSTSSASKLEEADKTAIDTNTIDTLGLNPDLVMDV